MTIIEMTVTGALMILGVIVLRAVTVSKLPKRAFIIMWEIALLRLILPISVPVKILPAVQTVTVIDSPSSYDIVAEPVRNDFVLVIPEEVREFIPSSAPAPVSVQTPPAANTPSFTVTPQMIWIAGAVVLAVFFAISYLRSIRRFRSAKQCDSDFIRGWLLEHPIWRPLSVKVSRAVSSPLTYGFLNPVILLPPEYENAGEQSLGFVLEHEYAHIRHFDALKKLVCAAALCVHWFNPLMWVLYLLYNRDMELWCDESVIKKFGAKSRAQYARLLISIEESRSTGVPLLSHFGRSTTEERIVSIMKFKKATFITICTAALLVAVTTAAIITTSINPVAKDAEVIDSEPISDSPEPTSDPPKYMSNVPRTYEEHITKEIFSNQGQMHVLLRAGEEIDYSTRFRYPTLNLDAGDRAIIVFDFGHELTDDEKQVKVVATKNSTTRYYLTDYIISDGTKLIYLFVAPETAEYFFEYLNPSNKKLPVIEKWVGIEGDKPYIFGGYGGDIEISSEEFEDVADNLKAVEPVIPWRSSTPPMTDDADSAITWSISYGQPSSGDLSGIKNYFDYTKNKWEIKDNVPIIEDPELYAVAVNTRVETDVLDKMIYPSISVVSGSNHGIVAMIEVDTKDLVLPEDMPEDAVLQFKEATENFDYRGLWAPLDDFISRDGTVYTYAIARYDTYGYPDELVYILHDFGYYDEDEFVTLVSGMYKLKIDAENINISENLKKTSEQKEVKGATLKAELTPYSLNIYASNSQLEELGLLHDKYFLIQGNIYEMHKRDGSTIGDWDGNFYENGIYNLTSTWTGWRDADDKDIGCHSYGFLVPVDVEEIEAVTVHGVRFDLKYAE